MRAAEEIHHHVKPGETLYSIARQYGTTVAALKDSNPGFERPVARGRGCPDRAAVALSGLISSHTLS